MMCMKLRERGRIQERNGRDEKGGEKNLKGKRNKNKGGEKISQDRFFQGSQGSRGNNKDGQGRQKGRKVRGTFPPQEGQKTELIMERPFQKQRLQDAPSFQCSPEGEWEGDGEKSVENKKRREERRDEC